MVTPTVIDRSPFVTRHGRLLMLGTPTDIGRTLMSGTHHAKDAAAAQPKLEDTDPEQQNRNEWRATSDHTLNDTPK